MLRKRFETSNLFVQLWRLVSPTMSHPQVRDPGKLVMKQWCHIQSASKDQRAQRVDIPEQKTGVSAPGERKLILPLPHVLLVPP